MIRGTTPSYILCVKNKNLLDKSIYATVGQNGVVITKTNDDIDVYYIAPDTFVNITLTQKDTLALQKGKAQVQVKFIDEDGIALSTEIKQLSIVDKALLEKTISYIGGVNDGE